MKTFNTKLMAALLIGPGPGRQRFRLWRRRKVAARWLEWRLNGGNNNRNNQTCNNNSGGYNNPGGYEQLRPGLRALPQLLHLPARRLVLHVSLKEYGTSPHEVHRLLQPDGHQRGLGSRNSG